MGVAEQVLVQAPHAAALHQTTLPDDAPSDRPVPLAPTRTSRARQPMRPTHSPKSAPTHFQAQCTAAVEDGPEKQSQLDDYETPPIPDHPK